MLRLSCSRQRRPRRNPRVIFRIIQFHFHVFPPFRCIVCGGATATFLATIACWRGGAASRFRFSSVPGCFACSCNRPMPLIRLGRPPSVLLQLAVPLAA